MNASPRVRLAFSFAGALTLGQARTALFNWLAARRQGGMVWVRGASAAPVRPEPIARTLDELAWLGLNWDAVAPLPAGRLGVYARVADELAAAGLASTRPLPLPRSGSPVCLHVLDAGGDPPARGPVLLTCSGLPTRTLIEAVDDHELGITHVVHEPARQAFAEGRAALHRALGWPLPHDVYLPPIAEPERGREPLGDYRRRDIQPLALANHLARLGWTPRGKQRLLSMDELAEGFAPERIARRPPPFDADRLAWFNHRCLGQLDPAEWVRLAAPRWQAAYGAAHRAEGTELPPERWQLALAEAVRDDLYLLEEAADKVRFAFVDPMPPDDAARQILSQPFAIPILRAFVDELGAVAPFAFAPIDAFVSALRWRFRDMLHVRSRDVMVVLRAALTGHVDGPCLVAAVELLGRQRSIDRATQALGSLTR